MNPLLHIIKGSQPGKRLAIFGGIHGNEKVGIMVLDYLKENLKITSGEVILVYANPGAIEKNVRFENKNLNRSLKRNQIQEVYEDILAQNLMDILDETDALLDLHAYSDPQGDGVPFIICHPDCYDVIQNFPISIVVSGFSEIEKGATDGYMQQQHKPGICVELGILQKPEKFVDLGIEIAKIFLAHFGCIQYDLDSKEPTSKIYMTASILYKRKHENFSFSKKYRTFDYVKKGELIAQDGYEKIHADEDGYIIFPRDNNPIGVEAFVFARKISH